MVEFHGSVKTPTETDIRILLLQKAETPLGSLGEAVDIILSVNTALSPKKISIQVQLQRMTYNKNDNLSGLLEATATSRILLPTIREVILSAARRINLSTIDETKDQMWN